MVHRNNGLHVAINNELRERGNPLIDGAQPTWQHHKDVALSYEPRLAVAQVARQLQLGAQRVGTMLKALGHYAHDVAAASLVSRHRCGMHQARVHSAIDKSVPPLPYPPPQCGGNSYNLAREVAIGRAVDYNIHLLLSFLLDFLDVLDLLDFMGCRRSTSALRAGM